jgi:hypothetical protein
MLLPETISPETDAAPFAVCALPTAERVSTEALQAAFENMLALFPDGAIAERIKGGLEEALVRHEWQLSERAICTRTQTVKLAKSGEDIICSCPDWKFKRKAHNGMCRHICAVELVRMAQAWETLTHHRVIADIGMTTAVLRSVLSCAITSHRSSECITFAFAQNTLAVNTDTLALTLRCDGYGACTLLLPPHGLADLVAQLGATDDDDVMIQVTPTHLDVLGDTLELSVALV